MNNRICVVHRYHEDLSDGHEIIGPFEDRAKAIQWVTEDVKIVMGDLKWIMIPGEEDTVIIVTSGFKKKWEIMELIAPEVGRMMTVAEWPNSTILKKG